MILLGEESRDRRPFAPQVISDVTWDDAALVHVAGNGLLIRCHACGGRHGWYAPSYTTQPDYSKELRFDSEYTSMNTIQ